MLRGFVAASIAALLLVACIPPPPDDDVIVDYDPETTVMGEIQERGRLLVGVPRGRSPFDDFTAGLGELVAGALDVETEVVPLPAEELLRAPQEGRVDISFPLLTMTEKLVRRFAFTDPVYIAHQRLLVDARSDIRGVEDLSGRVCQFITREVHRIDKTTTVLSPIGVNVKELNPRIVVVEPPETEGCIEDLLEGRVEAISAADWLLYPAISEHDELGIVGDDLTTEGYGAVVEPGASAWVDLVNGVFSEAGAEGDWQHIYDATFGPLVPEEVTYPDMTGEEAAALYPSDI